MHTPVIDFLQYCHWTRSVFDDMKAGHVVAIHATIAYHERFQDAITELILWHRRFETFSDRIVHARSGSDVSQAMATGKTAVFLGFQNCAPIDEDLGLVRVWHELGVRVMQLTYNAQSVLASGCYEPHDGGLTRFGKAVIKEMNRCGMLVDMSHSAAQSTIETIQHSESPIVISHANPSSWHDVPRNKNDEVLKTLAAHGGMLGFSLYPHHLAGGSNCDLSSFCEMVARAADLMGVDHLGFGSDLCLGRPDSTIDWMRRGSMQFPATDALEGGNQWGTKGVTLPAQPAWFRTNRDYPTVLDGLRAVGFTESEVRQIGGENWLRFLTDTLS
ncbi:MAG: dipeptidase [Alphaproteobacteria bacterium]|nr:dipeptidase [Alphaproteobacteria bacterium]